MNNVLQSPRAPGSTVKPVNVLAGLESGVIRATTSISDPGFAWIGTYQMRDWAVGGHGIVDPVKAIQQSCDTFMYTLGMWLGNWYNNKTPNGTTIAKWQQTDFVKGMNTLYTWEQKFGLGAATGIDLPEEVQGRFYVDDSIHRRIVPYDLDKAVSEVQTRGSYNNSGLLYDLASAAIGQMQQFTPMELAQYVMTIANGGKRLQPHVLKAIYKPGETPGLAQPVQEVKPIVQDQIKMQAGHLKVVQQGMYAVCNLPGGTAYGSFHNAPYHAAGKTGTAEYPEDGAMKNISEFIAYAPADHPQVAIVVRVPGGGESGETAVPIGRQLLDVYFQERHQFFPREQWKDGETAEHS
ncbi:MAG: hypothetical protein A2201_01880 [Alicyclobacillus sp. RIFOXYA1_FULL_53_8]|nr:MAG: hypothetical protein A2201_01880 [Alicyclobacillus sp. RIFOXYA1_FULL_53_8]